MGGLLAWMLIVLFKEMLSTTKLANFQLLVHVRIVATAFKKEKSSTNIKIALALYPFSIPTFSQVQ